MGFKIVSRYQRIKCVYFKTLNDALILWIMSPWLLVEPWQLRELTQR